MKNLYILFLLLVLSSQTFSNSINYIEPQPGAKYVSLNNNIIIGLDKPAGLTGNEIAEAITVTGSKSLVHYGEVIICSDNKKIIFKPVKPFENGEIVTVSFTGELLGLIAPGKKEYFYSFNTTSNKMNVNTQENINNVRYKISNNPGADVFTPPLFTVTVNNNPSEGYLFLAPYTAFSNLAIYDKNGSLYWSNITIEFGGDFKIQPNGHRTYFDGAEHKHFELDQYDNVIDTFYCGNGYVTDIHELLVLLNGHAWVMAYDTQTVDMTEFVEGGDDSARVVGTIIQEIDENRNVVFQWRSWDHFEITDAWHENLLAHYIDAVHGNAIDIDDDGNVLISSRHLDEITKINRTTGQIMWRFGGKNNEFTITNDTTRFFYQHDVRRINNGHITLYDNGNFHVPQYSRVLEYSLNEVNKTATLVWQYRHSPNVFSYWGGNAQRLENGNTLIGWGGSIPTVTEVDSNGVVRFEASYPQGVYTYRAYKFTLPGIPVNISNGHSETPEAFSLEQNYPNPFNPVTNISYNIAKASLAEITIYDILGREVKKLVNEFKQPGNYNVIFDGSQFSSGIYIYKLQAGNFTTTKKMILIK